MIVRDVLAGKGTDVVTIDPTASVTDLIARLAENQIGAVVVSSEAAIAGIISERDIARALHEHGPATLTMAVADLMTTDVRTCTPADEIADVAAKMTSGRFRHLPVVEDGALVGVVSIGDIVKSRIDELQTQADHLMDYLASP